MSDAPLERRASVGTAAGPATMDDEPLERRYALLAESLDALPDPMLITAADGRVLLRNGRARHLLLPGATLADAPPHPAAENARAVEESLAVLASSAAPGHGPHPLTLLDPDGGAPLHFELVSRALRASNAGEGARLLVLRDVTAQHRAARELERQVEAVSRAEVEARRERDRLDLMLDYVADPIVVTDGQARLRLMNRHAERLFHLARVDAASDEGTAANDAVFSAFVADFLAGTEQTRRARVTLTRPEGGELPAEIVAGKVADASGTAAVVAVLHDLTTQVENERLYEELMLLNAELERRVRSATTDLERQNARLRWQSRELEKANRLKSEFLASMSHELRTPINALLGYTALMLDRLYGELTPQQEEGLTRIRSSARHLLELINDILDLARIEAGKMPVHLETVVLDELLADVARQVEPLLQRPAAAAVAFRSEMPAQPVTLVTDATKVKQILLNLLSNAIKFTHEGEVRLAARVEGERIVLEVGDTGIGIREQDLAAIWEDFRQVDQSRTREYGGTGLGLSITRKLVRRLDGEIAVRSRVGEGSTFTVTLPLHAPARVVDAFAAPEGGRARRSRSVRGGTPPRA